MRILFRHSTRIPWEMKIIYIYIYIKEAEVVCCFHYRKFLHSTHYFCSLFRRVKRNSRLRIEPGRRSQAEKRVGTPDLASTRDCTEFAAALSCVALGWVGKRLKGECRWTDVATAVCTSTWDGPMRPGAFCSFVSLAFFSSLSLCVYCIMIVLS